MAVGLATNCDITRYGKFDRKNYFYPDNPQNYQISQLYLPICRNGHVDIETSAGKKSIGIHEIHMEEDAGKLIHDEWEDCSLVDYNRSGVPLIEIVSEPDMRSADEVIAYLEKLRLIIQYLGASDCKLQEGSMRADVNLSVREVGAEKFGTRTEMKNLNSFKAIARAIEGEKARQIELLEEGKAVIQETRRWDDNKEYSYAMRSKEDAQDYRYFPEPDLVPVVISEEWLEEVRSRQPELRDREDGALSQRVRYPGLRCRDSDGLEAYGGSLRGDDRNLRQAEGGLQLADGGNHASAEGEESGAGGYLLLTGASGSADRTDWGWQDQPHDRQGSFRGDLCGGCGPGCLCRRKRTRYGKR